MAVLLPKPIAFEWDKGNQDKSYTKHNVTNQECEEIFFSKGKKLFEDELHSQQENRYVAIGKTKQERLLFVVFTFRNNKIRVISARDLRSKNLKKYEEKT